ncbi:ATP-dependent DNA helicase PIF1-like [Senna tora]|uniref:ATP-dependent DNA helicase n=1 Tax=Senna tora TaxID=362788 RepID=A0A834TQH4_9FABA|nr:ATP-dependent DNA helicase PIF1-like [Senna tora]
MSRIYPAGERLQIHTPNMQRVQFNEYQSVYEIVGNERNTRTQLTEYFRMNRVDPEARNYLYIEFPQHYTWVKNPLEWKRRRSHKKAQTPMTHHYGILIDDPEVIPNGSKTQMTNASIVNSRLWRHFEVLHLKQNMRSRNDQGFSEWLLRVGDGIESVIENDMIKVPPDMGIPWEGEYPLNDLIDRVFPDLSRHMNDSSYMVERAILTLTNEEVDRLNDRIIAKHP